MRGFREDKECCGTCKWHRFEKDIFEDNAEPEWFCGNHTSDMYMEYTGYKDSCDDWED